MTLRESIVRSVFLIVIDAVSAERHRLEVARRRLLLQRVEILAGRS